MPGYTACFTDISLWLCGIVWVNECVCRWTLKRVPANRKELKYWRTFSDSTLEWSVGNCVP